MSCNCNTQAILHASTEKTTWRKEQVERCGAGTELLKLMLCFVNQTFSTSVPEASACLSKEQQTVQTRLSHILKRPGNKNCTELSYGLWAADLYRTCTRRLLFFGSHCSQTKHKQAGKFKLLWSCPVSVVVFLG